MDLTSLSLCFTVATAEVYSGGQANPNQPSIMEARAEQLAACGALSYAPSLSSGVRDALFSYWRLPRVLRAELRADAAACASPLTLADAAEIDWQQWLRSVDCNREDAVRETEATWALALEVEAAMESAGFKLSGRLDAAAEVLTHGSKLTAITSMLSTTAGDYYMGFLIGVTVLERALYDLHEQFAGEGEGASAKGRSSSMILRLLLESETIKRVLPPGLRHVLNILFLPSALNLRNLVWHGFVAPADFPRCFGCLAVVLTLELLPLFKYPPVQDDDRLFKISSYDDRFVIKSTETLSSIVERVLPTTGTQQRDDPSKNWILSSLFVPRGRAHLVERAFSILAQTGDELWFLFAVLPVLEHALRLKFIRANRQRWGISDEYGKAQVDAYYSTLDGFGQRDKHQVLLHPDVVMDSSEDKCTSVDIKFSETRPNALYNELPTGVLAVLLDLFMMHAGPNIRAKLCHGEADLDTLLLSSDESQANLEPLSVVTQVVIAAVGILSASDNASPQNVANLSKSTLVSSFHPFYRIYREMRACHFLSEHFNTQRIAFTTFTREDMPGSAETEPLTRLLFARRADAERSGEDGVVLIEKTSRVAELFRDEPTGSKKSLQYLLQSVKERVDMVEEQLRGEFLTHHRFINNGHSLFLSCRASDEHAHSGFQLSERDIETDEELVQKLLMLSDSDGISVSSCILDTLASIQRGMKSFEERIVQLEALILDGKARTNHRRSFLNSVVFFPVLDRVLRVCLCAVEHHLVQLFSVATTSSADSRRCPNAIAFEQLQRKLLQFVTAFEGCTGSPAAAQKSIEKSLELALQFLSSKAINQAIGRK